MRRLALSAIFVALAAPGAATEPMRLFSLGSAGEGGGYHVVARALCDVFNRAERGRIRCSPETTAGSLYNLTALREGQLDLAIAQSDWQRHALEGSSVFAAAGPDRNLRAVMSLYPEPFTVIARRDAGIASAEDLAGRRIDIGHPSSGRYATMRLFMELKGFTEASFSEVHELQSGATIDALCQDRIDATVLIVGHPNAAVARALDRCDAVLVPVAGPAIDGLIAENDDYSRYYIPMQAYPALAGDVATFAVVATIVTDAGVDSAFVGGLVRHTLDNLETLRATQPILGMIEPEAMRAIGLTAPLHPGAAAAFDAFSAGEE